DVEAEEYVNNDYDDDYDELQPKWYEKLSNIIITIGIATIVVVIGLIVFREPIRGLIGTGNEAVNNYDLQGEIEDYKSDVGDTLQGESNGSETDDEEGESTPQPVGTAKMEVAPEGEYTVGAKGDIDAGVWVVDEVLLDIYESEEAYKQNKDAIYSDVDFVDRQQLVKLIEGDYVVVQKGSIIFNETRPTKAVNLGDTLHLQEGNQYVVGKDFPEGFYTFYNLGLLELGED